MFSSNSDEWSTPQGFYDQIDKEFHFNLDPCATEENHKCENFFTAADDGLSRSWEGQRVFCNPPYSNIVEWVKKSYEEGHKAHTMVALLIPARTDTRYFHDYILNRAEIRFLKGRLKFGEAKHPAPFPSMLVIYKGPGVET